MIAQLTRIAAVLAAFALLAPALARADTPSDKRYHFELGAFASATWLPEPLAVDAGVVSDRIFGFGGALSLAYRGPYWLYPFLDVGYFNLASSTIHPLTRTGISNARVENSMSTWMVMAGPGFDYGLMRFRIGVGLHFNLMDAQGSGFHDTQKANGLLNCLEIAAYPFRTTGFRLGLELRAARLIYTGSTVIALGVSGAGDWLSW